VQVHERAAALHCCSLDQPCHVKSVIGIESKREHDCFSFGFPLYQSLTPPQSLLYNRMHKGELPSFDQLFLRPFFAALAFTGFLELSIPFASLPSFAMTHSYRSMQLATRQHNTSTVTPPSEPSMLAHATGQARAYYAAALAADPLLWCAHEELAAMGACLGWWEGAGRRQAGRLVALLEAGQD
jgi:hypothetical protein